MAKDLQALMISNMLSAYISLKSLKMSCGIFGDKWDSKNCLKIPKINSIKTMDQNVTYVPQSPQYLFALHQWT